MAAPRTRHTLAWALLLLLPVWAAPESPPADDASIAWRTCITAIQARLYRILQANMPVSPAQPGSIVLMDPATHSNIGDIMLSAAELTALRHLGWSEDRILVCIGPQSAGYGEKCIQERGGDPTDLLSNVSFLLYHAGGNWGDIYTRVQGIRLQRIKTLLSAGTSVLQLPQSHHYNRARSALRDSAMINQAGPANLTILWRQEDSYLWALQQMPAVRHISAPDMAFLLGPLPRPRPVPQHHAKHILFLLRNDRESAVVASGPGGTSPASSREASISAAIRALRAERGLSPRCCTFDIVDWRDALERYAPDLHKLQSGALKGTRSGMRYPYGYMVKAGMQLLSTASVVVTDRLHASIMALLMHKHHVMLDNSYGKVRKVRALAFNSSRACSDARSLRYDVATDLTDATARAVAMVLVVNSELAVGHDR